MQFVIFDLIRLTLRLVYWRIRLNPRPVTNALGANRPLGVITPLNSNNPYPERPHSNTSLSSSDSTPGSIVSSRSSSRDPIPVVSSAVPSNVATSSPFNGQPPAAKPPYGKSFNSNLYYQTVTLEVVEWCRNGNNNAMASFSSRLEFHTTSSHDVFCQHQRFARYFQRQQSCLQVQFLVQTKKKKR